MGHFARVCRSKHKQPASTSDTTPQISANAIRVQSQQGNHIQLYNIVGNRTEPAPTIVVHMSSSSSIREVEVLPDSGADISAAGQEILGTLGQHIDNLLPSNISPRAVNGSCMTPMGKIPVTIQLEGRSYRDDLHIYPGVTGALISWRAAKELGILPAHYPYPDKQQWHTMPQLQVKATSSQSSSNHSSIAEKLIREIFPIFDGQVTTMEGEVFTISLMEGAEPFCVKAPRSIPFAYRRRSLTYFNSKASSHRSQRLQSGVHPSL